MKTNESKIAKEQAYQTALEMEKEIIQINDRQYIGMPREERKEIILTAPNKTTQLRIFCCENGLDWQEIVFVAKRLI